MIALSISAFIVPATAVAYESDNPLERQYENAHAECIDIAGEDAAGRNIQKFGYGNNYSEPTPEQLQESIGTLQACIAPEQEPVVEETTTVAEETTASTGTSAPVDINCESGGDYSIDTGNGYYGAYQFDSSTWDTYGDPAYGEANQAPPAVQDAAAASVPYDAWPNC